LRRRQTARMPLQTLNAKQFLADDIATPWRRGWPERSRQAPSKIEQDVLRRMDAWSVTFVDRDNARRALWFRRRSAGGHQLARHIVSTFVDAGPAKTH
jgi:hypothetical protein